MPRSLPVSPSLELDRKRAKALLKRVRARDAEAAAQFRAHHPRFAPADPADVAAQARLADAQLVVARAYGFRSWPSWKQFVETRQLDRAQQADALVEAACSNDVRRARVLLEADPGLARLTLFAACACGEVEAARRLIERDPEAVHRKAGPKGWEPLLYACFSRLIRADPRRAAGVESVVACLLEQGADPNASYAHIWAGKAFPNVALFGAAGVANHFGMTHRLLEAGADPDEGRPEPAALVPGVAAVGTELGTEALYHAAEFGDTACLERVLQAEPHPLRVSYALGRALDFASCDERVAVFLAYGADPNLLVHVPYLDADFTLLHKAIKLGRDRRVICRLLDAGGDPHVSDSQGVSLAHDAAYHTGTATLALLRKRGLDVPMPDGPPVNVAVMCQAAARGEVGTLRRCFDAGLSVDATLAEQDGSALHWAAWRGNYDAALLLLEHGADLDRVNGYGGDALGTAIHGSVCCRDPEGGMTMAPPEEATPGRYAEVVKLLIDRGAKLPSHLIGNDAVQDMLRRYGVAEAGDV